MKLLFTFLLIMGGLTGFAQNAVDGNWNRVFLLAAIVSGVYSGIFLFQGKPSADWTSAGAKATVRPTDSRT